MGMSRIMLAILCAWMAISQFAPAARAQNIDLGERRLVHLFDFEEADELNFEDLPIDWYRVGSEAQDPDPGFDRQPLHQQLMALRGYPSYSPVRFNIPSDQKGEHSLYLGLNGANAGAFLKKGAVPVIPDSDYVITARVKTSRFKHARAVMMAYFIDDAGRRIASSVVRTEPLVTNERWETLSVQLDSNVKGAAWIGVELHAMQQDVWDDGPPAAHDVRYVEVNGGAWFDDVGIWQLPHVSVRASTPTGVFVGDDRPTLDMAVRDVEGKPLITDVSVYDVTMQLRAKASRKGGVGQFNRWSWRPPVDAFGWYVAQMKVFDATTGDLVARGMATFVWLPKQSDALPPEDRDRFTIIAPTAQARDLPMLDQLLSRTGLNSLVISGWSPHTRLDQIDVDQQLFERALLPMLQDGRQVAFNLHPLPRVLHERLNLGPDDVFAMFDRRREIWQPALTSLMLRHAQRVRTWYLGSPMHPEAFEVPSLASTYRSAREGVESVVPGPRLVVPWSLHESRRRDVPELEHVLIDVPPSVAPGQIGMHLTGWESGDPVTVQLHLRERPATELAQAKRVTGFALRMLHAWEADVDGVVITEPWSFTDDRGEHLAPGPLLGVYSHMAQRLAGRRAIGRIAIRPGVHAVIFDGSRGGMLAIWRDSTEEDTARLALYLGEKPIAYDVWGNAKPLPTVDNKHQVDVGLAPILIEGIDPKLALFRAGFSVTPGFIESSRRPQTIIMRLTNPWDRAIAGEYTIDEPEAWRIDPRRGGFSLSPGETVDIAMRVILPDSEIAGDKLLKARIKFGSENGSQITLVAPLEVGLKNLRFDASLTLERNPDTGKIDAIVTQLITNVGDKPTSIYAYAFLPGHPRQQRLLQNIPPDQTVLRVFRFADAEEALAASRIRVGVRHTAGPAVLNAVLTLEAKP